jgi:hypothetical protein
MRAFMLLLVAAVSMQAAEPDAEQLVRRSLVIFEDNWNAARDREYDERVRKIDLDSDGNEKKLDIKSFRVFQIDGSPYQRLISRFDKPLSAAEEESERIRLEEQKALRAGEPEKKRLERRRKYNQRRAETFDSVREIPNAFELELLGAEPVGGRTAYVIGVRPRAGYKPASLRAKVFTELHGKLWVDRESGAWLKLEAELMGPVTFGWFLVRIHKGARVEAMNQEIGGGRWAMNRLWYRASVRIGLVKLMAMDEEHTYTEPPSGGPSPLAAGEPGLE